MNKEYFIKQAKLTSAEYRQQGIVFVGSEPSSYGLRDFQGYHQNRYGKMSKGNQSGCFHYNYFIDDHKWRELFGPLPWEPQDKESQIKNKISSLKEELARAESELAKLEEKKKMDLFPDLNDNLWTTRGKLMSDGSKIAVAFGSVRAHGNLAYRGFYLGAGGHTKWKIEEDDQGAQILVPDLKK